MVVLGASPYGDHFFIVDQNQNNLIQYNNFILLFIQNISPILIG